MLNAKNITEKFLNNKKVAENYFFMTFLQGSSMIIALLLYPYLIRVLGKEGYGTYVFIFSNIRFFEIFTSFGFYYPALKSISLNPDDNQIKSRTVSEVLTAQLCLFALCAIVFLGLIFSISFVRENAIYYVIIFVSSLGGIFFPTWYFQGIQKMKFVTYLNLIVRASAIPLIFIFVKSPADLLKYTLIVSLLSLGGSIFAFFYLQIKEKIHIRLVSLASLKPLVTDSLPFFWTSAFGTLKQESVTFIIGTLFSMGNVALWDLANKIVNIPRLVTVSINAAIFPKIIKNHKVESVKKIIKYETFIGLGISALIAIFSPPFMLW